MLQGGKKDFAVSFLAHNLKSEVAFGSSVAGEHGRKSRNYCQFRLLSPGISNGLDLSDIGPLAVVVIKQARCPSVLATSGLGPCTF